MKRPRRELLLEVGCEEIPAQMLDASRLQLEKLLEEGLEAHGLLEGSPVRSFATPRRLIVTCSAVAAAEPDRVSEVVGPPKRVAYDAEGKPTRAAESFSRKQGVRLSQLKVVETPKGEYLAAVSRQKGRPSRKVLGELLPQVISSVSFPRTMYWTSPQGMRFIRPIRWLLALWDGRVIPFEIEGVSSGDTTWGHRILSNKPIRVGSFAEYRQRLQQAKVFIEAGQRRQKIEKQLTALLKGTRLRRRADNELLDMLVHLVEFPGVIRGDFDKEFLNLPAEVLVTVMRHHQKYFSVENRQGRLAPHFLAVIDLDADRAGEIRRGHEAVLRARFRDGQFFWEADQRKRLEDRLPLLEQSTFVAELGSYRQKVERVVRLATSLGESVGSKGRRADIDSLRRAAHLCKSDLSTEMVGEFPELQGVVGGLYARAQGESETVAEAVYEHYRPAGADDALPESLEGSLLSLADKLDTVAGCFAVGLIPSGSRDPYALRRAAGGAVRVVVEKGLRLSIHRAVEEAVKILQQCRVAVEDPAALARSVENFLGDRARHLFREVRGFAYDEVNAVFAAGWDDLVDALARQEALRRIRPTPHFEPLAVAFKRIRNILEQAGDGEQRAAQPVETSLLEPGAEQELYQRFQELRPRVGELREKHDYTAAFRLVASLRPYVDRYFDTVLVMTREEKVRENRLSLLAQLLLEFSTMADFSEIVVTSGNKE
jgi:glycyl-tRNA synthetase beta chain